MLTSAKVADLRRRWAEFPLIVRMIVWIISGVMSAAPFLIAGAPVAWLIGLPWKWCAAIAWLFVVVAAVRDRNRALPYLT